MSVARRSIVVATALLLAVSGYGALAQAAFTPTTAAWTDTVHASAPATAGTWIASSPLPSTCIAYAWDDSVLAGCTVAEVRNEMWGAPGTRVRNYYLRFDVPAGTKAVSFDVDLNATVDGSGWSWETTGITQGGQIIPDAGWTCAQFPRIRARGADWQQPTIYFQVAEGRSSSTASCT